MGNFFSDPVYLMFCVSCYSMDTSLSLGNLSLFNLFIYSLYSLIAARPPPPTPSQSSSPSPTLTSSKGEIPHGYQHTLVHQVTAGREDMHILSHRGQTRQPNYGEGILGMQQRLN